MPGTFFKSADWVSRLLSPCFLTTKKPMVQGEVHAVSFAVRRKSLILGDKVAKRTVFPFSPTIGPQDISQ